MTLFEMLLFHPSPTTLGVLDEATCLGRLLLPTQVMKIIMSGMKQILDG